MQLQTQPTPVFTVFGSYVPERQGDYFPLYNGRTNGEGRFDTGKIEPADALLEPARQCQQINSQ